MENLIAKTATSAPSVANFVLSAASAPTAPAGRFAERVAAKMGPFAGIVP